MAIDKLDTTNILSTMDVMKKNSPAQLQRHAEQAAAMLKHLANPVRLMILCQLIGAERSVGALQEAAGISQSALSQHLAKMREAGILGAERRGQMVFYRIADMRAHALLSTLYLIYCRD
jgi:ArsR family transcriptional regulator, virulence genes transcriptional regulator